MGYITITEQEAFTIAKEVLKAKAEQELLDVLIVPTSKARIKITSDEMNYPDSIGDEVSTTCSVEMIVNVDSIVNDYGQLVDFYRKPASEQSISSSEARQLLSKLKENAFEYVEPEHRYYEDRVKQEKVGEEI